MLEMRQSGGGGVTTIVFLDDLSLRAGFQKAGTMATKVLNSAFHQSLEEPVAASLTNSRAIWLRWFANEVEARYERTGGGLEIIADVLEKAFEYPNFFDSAFNNSADGGNFDSEPSIVAREQEEQLKRYLEHLAARMGLQHPDIAACAALLVIERTIGWIRITGSSKEAQTARLLFQCLNHA